MKNKETVSGVRKDIDDLAIVTKNSFDRVEGKLDKLEGKFDGMERKQEVFQESQDRLERGMKAILEVVQENNILLKEFRTHPERIARLERSTFGSK